jgi:hypothetical protein
MRDSGLRIVDHHSVEAASGGRSLLDQFIE